MSMVETIAGATVDASDMGIDFEDCHHFRIVDLPERIHCQLICT